MFPIEFLREPEVIEKILTTGHALLKQVHELPEGSAICLKEDDFIPFWQYQYNPEKGETAESEMNKWLGSLKKEFNIIWWHEPHQYKYYFKKCHSDQESYDAHTMKIIKDETNRRNT